MSGADGAFSWGTPPIDQAPQNVQILRRITLITLALFLLFALIIIASAGAVIGSWLFQVVPSAGPGGFLVLGFMLAMVTIFALISVIRNNRSTLVASFIFMIALTIAQIAIPAAMVIPGQDDISTSLNSAFARAWAGATIDAKNAIQSQFKCCGYEDWPGNCYDDGLLARYRAYNCTADETVVACCQHWVQALPNIDPSLYNQPCVGDIIKCCEPACPTGGCTGNKEGCASHVYDTIKSNVGGLIGVGVAFALLEMAGIALMIAYAFLLWRWENSHGGKAGKTPSHAQQMGGGGAAHEGGDMFED